MALKIATSDEVKQAVGAMPDGLVSQYKAWRGDGFDAELFEGLTQGQHPHNMVVSCCDSRVNPTEILQTKSGEIFVHRNVANLIPRYGACDSTGASVAFAVGVLGVKHVLVMGHSGCGGIRGGFDLLCNEDGDAGDSSGPLKAWLTHIGDAFSRLDRSKTQTEQISDLEKLSVVVSLEHLLDYPPVAEKVEGGQLTLHGLWHDIGQGALLEFDGEAGIFKLL